MASSTLQQSLSHAGVLLDTGKARQTYQVDHHMRIRYIWDKRDLEMAHGASVGLAEGAPRGGCFCRGLVLCCASCRGLLACLGCL